VLEDVAVVSHVPGLSSALTNVTVDPDGMSTVSFHAGVATGSPSIAVTRKRCP
jgi:hypothetical protein